MQFEERIGIIYASSGDSLLGKRLGTGEFMIAEGDKRLGNVSKSEVMIGVQQVRQFILKGHRNQHRLVHC